MRIGFKDMVNPELLNRFNVEEKNESIVNPRYYQLKFLSESIKAQLLEKQSLPLFLLKTFKEKITSIIAAEDCQS